MDTGAAAFAWTLALIGLVIGAIMSPTSIGLMIGLGAFFLGMSVILGASVIEDAIDKIRSR